MDQSGNSVETNGSPRIIPRRFGAQSPVSNLLGPPIAFTGLFQHKLEEKARTSLPARWKVLLMAMSQDKLVVTQGPERSLWVFPQSVWERFLTELTQKLQTVSLLSPERRLLTHFFVSPAQEVSVDRLGRVLLPPALREWASLEDEIVWVGAMDHFELWSAQGWKRRTDALADLSSEGALELAAANIGFGVDAPPTPAAQPQTQSST